MISAIEQRICEKHGAYEARIFYGSDDKPIGETGCPLCAAEDRPQAELPMSSADKLAKKLADAGCPEIFQRTEWDDFEARTEDQKRMLQLAKEIGMYNELRWLTLIGTCGVGKTMLAACAMRSRLASGQTVLYTTETQIMRQMKACWTKSSKITEESVLASFIQPDFLVIDELRSTQWGGVEGTFLGDVIDGRYQRYGKWTMILGNTNVEQLKNHLEERSLSRLSTGIIYQMVGTDYRKAGKNNG